MQRINGEWIYKGVRGPTIAICWMRYDTWRGSRIFYNAYNELIV